MKSLFTNDAKKTPAFGQEKSNENQSTTEFKKPVLQKRGKPEPENESSTNKASLFDAPKTG